MFNKQFYFRAMVCVWSDALVDKFGLVDRMRLFLGNVYVRVGLGVYRYII
ncbi:MAG: hypothetical protein LBJ00_00925 [Planctomycetaceae bacterium]|nr:hypothetical protein [Planctomycetaceae bacterium]